MFQNHEPSGRKLYYVVTITGPSSKLGNFWICICMTGWINIRYTTRSDGQNKGQWRTSNKQIKVAVCNEFVETIICEYVGFKTVFIRWMPEQVSRDQNCWSIVWSTSAMLLRRWKCLVEKTALCGMLSGQEEEDNTAVESHIFISVNKIVTDVL